MAGLSIPNTGEASFADQAAPDGRDFDAIVANLNQTGVVTGCVVTQHSTGAMSVDVASGVVMSAGVGAYVAAVSGLTVATADATNLRYDLVVASSAGTLSVITGTAGANPAFPAMAAGYVLLAALRVAASATSILTVSITDKRTIKTVGPYFDQHAALKNFRAAKGKIANRSMDVLCVGTSLTEGYYATTESARWISQLRQGLQANLNPAGAPGGEGYVPVVHGSTAPSNYGTPVLSDRVVMSGTGYTIDRTGNSFGLGRRAVILASSTATATFTTTVCDRFWMLYAQGPGVGNISIQIDGGAAVIFPAYNATRYRSGRMWDSGPLTRGVHTVVVKADNTATAPANVYSTVLEGFMLFDGDGAAGPANMLTPEWANLDGNYDPVAANSFWNISGSQSGVTVARSSAQAFSGTYSLAATCSGAANPIFSSGGLQVRARSALTFSVRMRAAATARSWIPYLTFYVANADGSLGAQVGGSVTGTTVADTTSGWTVLSVSTDAPDGAGWALMSLQLSGTPAASEVHYFDGFDLGLTSYTSTGAVNTTYQDPSSGAQQGRGVRVWDSGHAGFLASDFNGASTDSVGGSVTANGAWLDALDTVNPDVVFIEFGTNETSAGTPPATMRDNIVTIVNNVKGRASTLGLSIILVAQNPIPTVAANAAWIAQDGYRDQIRAAAIATGSGFIDIGAYFPTTLQPAQLGAWTFPQPNVHDLLYEDGVHGTDAGQAEVGQAFLQYLLQGDPRSIVKATLNNDGATTDPSTSNDITAGYSVGSRWINATTGWQFTALSVTAGAAIWMRISPTSLLPAFVAQTGAANILHPWHDAGSAANAGSAQNQGVWTQHVITKPTAITGLAFQVTTAAVGGTSPVGRVAIFNDNGAGGVGTLIADLGTTAITSTGLKTVAGSRTLQPGIYWTAFKYEYSVVPTTAPAFTCMSSVITLPGPALNSTNYRCLALSGIVGAFTSNPAATPSTTQAPIVGIVVT